VHNVGPFPFAVVFTDNRQLAADNCSLYPVEMAVDMYRAIPRSALWVVPNGGHGPIFFDAAPQFVQTVLSFFRTQAGTPRP
jgi:pimeloyl-ACP methyl ester carboxylesterase